MAAGTSLIDRLTPAPIGQRPRWIHWLAWLCSLASFGILAAPVLGGRAVGDPTLAMMDLWISVAFAIEFLTRSGLRREGWRYAVWRWFDFVAMVPVLFIEQHALLYAWFVWLVLFARLGRLVDRTLGDGFVGRNLAAVLQGVEEEISDRVLVSIMSRIEGELAKAKFGEAAAQALAEQRDSILKRIYAEQLPETGALAKVANFTGLTTAIERMEAHVFDAIVKVVGSPETDALIRDVVTKSLAEAREEIGQRSWQGKLGVRKPSNA